MANVEIRNLTSGTVRELSLDDAVFGERPKTHVVYEEVKRYLASLRSGTHATKTRGMVSGAGRKLWKQKGTGRARVGSIRSPLWRHGGIVHGPHPHPHDLDIPRKAKKLAMRVALTEKLRRKAIVVLDRIEVGEPKTRLVAEMVEGQGWTGSTLIVEDGSNRNLRLGARNLQGIKVVAPSALSVYDVLRHERLVLTEGVAAKLVEMFRP